MNNDLISRSVLIKRMREVISHTPLVFQIDVQSACETIEALVDVAPAVDAEPVRHGEWSLLPADIWDAYECSVCKKVEDHPSRFCPNCGAQMYIENGTEAKT